MLVNPFNNFLHYLQVVLVWILTYYNLVIYINLPLFFSGSRILKIYCSFIDLICINMWLHLLTCSNVNVYLYVIDVFSGVG